MNLCSNCLQAITMTLAFISGQLMQMPIIDPNWWLTTGFLLGTLAFAIANTISEES